MIRRLFLLFLTLLLILPSYAVSDIQITPEHPKVGDIVTITGKANPNEEINCQAWFEVTPIISPPCYGYIMKDVEIPTTPNNFKVIAENVNDLSVYVKIGVWIPPKSATADTNGIAVVSQSNVPTGTYEIRIKGTIKDPSKPVKLKIIASTTIKADENGYFKYSYRANNIPEGTVVHLNIGGVSKDILIEGNTPTPPIIEENTTTNENTTSNQIINLDKEPPKIIILSPIQREFNQPNVTFDIVVEDNSPCFVAIYLNGEEIDYKIVNNHYTGTLYLKDGKNTLEILAEDKYGNKNKKIIYLTYYKTNDENSTNKGEINTTTNTSKSPENKANITKVKTAEEKNIIEGTIIKNIGKVAELIIQDGTEVSTKGDIQIKEIALPNITLTYYITPEDAKFKPPLTLKVKIKPSQNKEIKVLYYDSKLKSWKSIPYTVDGEGNIIIKIDRGGYYAIKENQIEIDKNTTNSPFTQLIGILKIIVSVVINLIKSLVF